LPDFQLGGLPPHKTKNDMKNKIILFLLAAVFLISTSSGSELAWLQTDYSPPDFEAFFPDDAAGGKILDDLWKSENKDSRSDTEILGTVRNGLRNTKQHRTVILRWIGNKYIWGKSPQNPDAIELMYHATDYPERTGVIGGTRHYAVYFGLSVVNSKTPSILRALANLCMDTDDPNTLSRVAWGAKSQQEELLKNLKPYLESEDEAVRSKAEVCEQIFRGELNAFAWAKNKREQAQTVANKATIEIKPVPDNLKSVAEAFLQGLIANDQKATLSNVWKDDREAFRQIFFGQGLPSGFPKTGKVEVALKKNSYGQIAHAKFLDGGAAKYGVDMRFINGRWWVTKQ
jgi:hypothetical protein